MNPRAQNMIIFATLAGVLMFLGFHLIGNITDAEEDVISQLTTSKWVMYYLLFIICRAYIFIILSFLDNLFRKHDRTPEYYPLVSLIMPCYNEEKVVEKAILSASKINYPNFEIIVVDDGSLDVTTEIAKKFEEKFRIRVVYQENAGKAEALNRGISESVGDYVLCMDADSLLDENVLMKSIPYFENNPNLGAVAGSVYVGNPVNLLTKFQKLEYITGLNLHKKAQSYLNLVTIVPGPIGIFRKSAVEKIGGYKSNTFAEDCDLTIRLLLADYQIVYADEVVAITEAPTDFSSLVTQRYRWSRGMVQAIFSNLGALRWNQFSLKSFAVLAYMTLECVLTPIVSFAFALLTLSYALTLESPQMVGTYFIGITLVSMTMSLYSVITEKYTGAIFLLSIINGVTYGLSLEVMRFFAIVDELFKIPMKWGVLKRKGMNST